jgi:predicted PurR-regulated permease PerM
MIPLMMKKAWARVRLVDEDDPPHATSMTLQEHDLQMQNALSKNAPVHDVVVRYAVVSICLILTMGALSLAKAIAVPLIAGLIFGFVLGPMVDRLMRLGMPQNAAAIFVVVLGVLFMMLIIGIFAAPFAIWSDQLPGIFMALQLRFSDLIAVAHQFEGVTKNLSAPSGVPTVNVEVGNTWLNFAITSSAAAGGLLIFVATIYFYLATRRHLKARALRLCFGSSARRAAGLFLIDIETKLATYFGVVSVINLGMGLIATLIAWLAGMPFPLFWGMLAFILNYISFVGPIIMTVLIAGALLIDKSNSWLAAWPAFAYFLVHLVEGNVVTPMLVGRRLTLSPFLVFVSFIFWLWLWGPVGAILSVPILLLMTLGFEAAATYRQLENAEV